MSAEIVSYDSATTTATVRPAVRELVLTASGLVYAEALEIPGCPVRWPGAGGVSITWPLPAGTLVTMLVRDRSHDEVDAGAEIPSAPASQRRWDLSDAEVWPMGYGARDPLPSDATAADGLVIRLPSGDALAVGAASATRALALATETAAALAQIQTVINALVLPVSGATAGPPVPPPFVTTTTAADIQTDRVKVDA